MKNKAFTLVEICIVVSIIGLLAAMIIPAAQKIKENNIRDAIANGTKVEASNLEWYRERNKGKPDIPVTRDQPESYSNTQPQSTKSYGNLSTFKVNGKTYVLIKDETYDKIFLEGVYWKLVPVDSK